MFSEIIEVPAEIVVNCRKLSWMVRNAKQSWGTKLMISSEIVQFMKEFGRSWRNHSFYERFTHTELKHVLSFNMLLEVTARYGQSTA